MYEATPSAVDCRTISEVGTPGSRSFTPVPMFNALFENNFDEAAAPDLDNHSSSDTRSPDSRSPTPTPTLYGHHTGLTHSPPPSVMLDQNEELISVEMMEYNIRASWNALYAIIRSGMPFPETQYSHCKDVTNQYIQGSPNPDAARCAVLDLARKNSLFMPRFITDITIMRKLLQYWLDIGYDINQRNSNGNTTLLEACSWGFPYEPPRHWKPVVSLLVQFGANVHDTSLQNGRGALHLAMESIANMMALFSYHTADKAMIEETVEVLVVLLEAGCDPSTQDLDGFMPLDMINTEHKFRSYWKVGRDLAKKAWGIALAKTSESRRLRAGNAQASSSHSPIVIEDDDFWINTISPTLKINPPPPMQFSVAKHFQTTITVTDHSSVNLPV
jgi:ankyrin repeat protein